MTAAVKKPVDLGVQQTQLIIAEVLVYIYDIIGDFLGKLETFCIGEVRDGKLRQTVLPLTEEITRAAHLQILVGNSEAVIGGAHHLEPLPRDRAETVADKDTEGLRLPSSDTSAQLVQL